MIIQNKTNSVALTCTQRQKSTQNLNITISIEVTIIGVAMGGRELRPRGPGSPPSIEMPTIEKM